MRIVFHQLSGVCISTVCFENSDVICCSIPCLIFFIVPLSNTVNKDHEYFSCHHPFIFFTPHYVIFHLCITFHQLSGVICSSLPCSAFISSLKYAFREIADSCVLWISTAYSIRAFTSQQLWCHLRFCTSSSFCKAPLTSTPDNIMSNCLIFTHSFSSYPIP